ncbi:MULTISPECIES: PF20097 family protein [Clostridium]|uniref:PF20097 family protein n=1 Tax=Clostridium frigoriphilum TaxID=443253 RepID=A0ABU7UWH5_9CLOT|nr:PF20097 family protein [Clostridium sp. DSM 17811]MBU3100816.1 hypothetical protein [Clostridium sp. DSM 17811]
MARCPYCENEMKKGFVVGDPRAGLIWVGENQKRSIIQKFNNENCIVLEESNMFHKTRLMSNYCDTCKKIIIDIK